MYNIIGGSISIYYIIYFFAKIYCLTIWSNCIVATIRTNGKIVYVVLNKYVGILSTP